MPDLQERALTARRAAGLGAALSVRPTAAAPVKRALEQVLDDPAAQRAAQAFATRHGAADRAAILPKLVSEVL